MPVAVHEEIDLARRLIGGDATAFDSFVDLFRSKIFQYSYLMCGQREDAEEVAQETLMSAFQSFGQLRQPELVKSWIFRIARNACTHMRRRSVFAPEQELSLDELRPAWRGEGPARKLDIADWSALPEDRVLHSELGARLREAIRALPETHRSVLLLRDVEEMSTAETSEALEISEDAVKTRLHRARLAVRAQLDQYLRTAGSAA